MPGLILQLNPSEAPTQISRMLESAIALACAAHANQVDKVGEAYILHLLRVMLTVTPGNEVTRTVAVLHDIVEDELITRVSRHELARMQYPAIVRDAIHTLTRQSAETYEAYIERVLLNPVATAVKTADLIDNLDPERMNKLDAETRKRLRDRYLKAYDGIKESRQNRY